MRPALVLGGEHVGPVVFGEDVLEYGGLPAIRLLRLDPAAEPDSDMFSEIGDIFLRQGRGVRSQTTCQCAERGLTSPLWLLGPA